MGKEKDLFEIKHHFSEYYTFLQEQLEKYHYALTGMGVNPYRVYNKNVPIPNGRYRMLFHHLKQYLLKLIKHMIIQIYRTLLN